MQTNPKKSPCNFDSNDCPTPTRLSLPNQNHTLARLAFMLSGNRLLVSLIGFDRPGILAYLTKRFFDCGASIEACFGQRLNSGVGSYFEITSDGPNTLKRLSYEFMADDAAFPEGEPFTPTRFFNLEVKVCRDARGLLYQVARVLAAHNVNVSHFMAHKVDDFLLELNDTMPDANEWQVHINARLELPEGVDVQPMKEEMLTALPEGAVVKLTEQPSELSLDEVGFRD